MNKIILISSVISLTILTATQSLKGENPYGCATAQGCAAVPLCSGVGSAQLTGKDADDCNGKFSPTETLCPKVPTLRLPCPFPIFFPDPNC